MVRLSIIIVSYNVKFYLQQCIDAIQNSVDVISEIIVVDNNSTDGSVEFLERKYGDSITLIKNKDNTGFGKACNQGLAIVQGQYVLFLNPDTIIGTHTLENVLSFADSIDNLGLIGLRMINENNEFLAESKRSIPSPKASFYRLTGLSSLLSSSQTANEYYAPHVREKEVGKVEVISGAFMLGETNTVQRLKGFDEDYFMYGEDIDISYRSLLAGLDNYYLGSETIIHYKGKSTDKTKADYLNQFYGAMSIFHRKHIKDSHSWVFNLLIGIAIFLKKSMDSALLLLRTLFIPFVEFLLFVGGGYVMMNAWSKFYFGDPSYYHDSGATINLIVYSAIWVLILLLGSGYRYYAKRSIGVMQLIIGFIIILVGYSLLPTEWRSSRVLISLYFLWNIGVVLMTRMVYRFLNKNKFELGHNIGLVASPEIVDTIYNDHKTTQKQFQSIFPISPKQQLSDSRYVGEFSNVIALSKKHALDCVLINIDEFDLTEVKASIDALEDLGIRSKFIDQHDAKHILSPLSPKSDFRDSITLEYSILFWENKFLKRCLDVIFSLLLLPISVVHPKVSTTLLFKVLINKKSFIGYQTRDSLHHKLPKIKSGLIPVSSKRGLIHDVHLDNLEYALYYSIFKDFRRLVSFIV